MNPHVNKHMTQTVEAANVVNFDFVELNMYVVRWHLGMPNLCLPSKCCTLECNFIPSYFDESNCICCHNKSVSPVVSHLDGKEIMILNLHTDPV